MVLTNIIYQARFSNVRALATHLSQLEHLSIIRSYNWQTPYLLRSVLPEGLPKLKSLEIHQVSCAEPFVRSTEGAMWYEAEDGQFLHEKKIKNAQKFVDGPYLHSVAQGAPHLRELCLQGSSLYMHRLVSLEIFIFLQPNSKSETENDFPSSRTV